MADSRGHPHLQHARRRNADINPVATVVLPLPDAGAAMTTR
ncbi:MAG TPA: hypothetical protein VFQ77_17590 [Pseudonocardiaceae bacterium]|nr:hypothetical protein [Pseudonocardiaceae bacterium]